MPSNGPASAAESAVEKYFEVHKILHSVAPNVEFKIFGSAKFQILTFFRLICECF